MLVQKRSVFQKSVTNRRDAFQLPCYRVFKTYLTLLGQYPYESERTRKIKVIVLVCSVTSLLIPSVIQFITSVREKDIDTALECVPCIVSTMVSLIKILNHYINREKFQNMFNLMREQWDVFEHNGEINIVNEITKQGSKMGSLYRNSLWGFAVIFLSIPFSTPILDIVAPLNKTRAKLPLFKLNYIVNTEEHFYAVYFHSAWCSLVVVLIVSTMDSLYIVIIHYVCSLFVLCGYQIKKATKIDELRTNTIDMADTKYEGLKRCVITHYEAIKFYEYMDSSTCTSYLFQVGLNMTGITITAVQAAMNFDRPEEVLRIIMFLMGQQFHLFALSLPGQVLIDRSSGLNNHIYFSTWYQLPLKCEKLLHIALIRSNKPCKLTAGGLYEMNVENFGMIVKTCMSYFTILLSLRE